MTKAIGISIAILFSMCASLFAADVAAIKTLTGSKEVRFAWCTYVSGTYSFLGSGTKLKMYVLDTRDNTQRQLTPGGSATEDCYCDPLFLADGCRIVYSIAGTTNKTYAIDWDGQNNRLLCSGQAASPAKINGVQWVYFQKVLNGPIYRLNVDNTSQEELVFTYADGIGQEGNQTFQPWFHVSYNGTRASFTQPSNVNFVAYLTPGTPSTKNSAPTFQPSGCWNAMSPDPSMHHWVFAGGHQGVMMFDSANNLLNNGELVMLNGPFSGKAMCFHKWASNDVNFVTMTGPGTGFSDRASGNNQLYFGKMTNWASASGWVQVTNVAADQVFWNDAYVGDVSCGSATTVAAPVFSPAATTFMDSVVVTITTATSGATIRYTTDGTDPTSSSTAYSAPVHIKQTTTLKARAFKAGLSDSPITSSAYTKTTLGVPVITPAAGTFSDSVRVTITPANAGDTIRYTTDGADPVSASTRYTAPFWVKKTSTVKARAVSGVNASAIASSSYTITVANPITVTAPNGGETFKIGQTMTIRWTANTNVVNQVVLMVSVNDGLTWLNIYSNALNSTDTKWGAYPWVIPATLPDDQGTPVSLMSTQVRIKVQMYFNVALYDISDAVYRIDAASKVARPNLNAALRPGDVCMKVFDLSGALRGTVNLPAGTSAGWRTGDGSGTPRAAGVYFLIPSTGSLPVASRAAGPHGARRMVQ